MVLTTVGNLFAHNKSIFKTVPHWYCFETCLADIVSLFSIVCSVGHLFTQISRSNQKQNKQKKQKEFIRPKKKRSYVDVSWLWKKKRWNKKKFYSMTKKTKREWIIFWSCPADASFAISLYLPFTNVVVTATVTTTPTKSSTFGLWTLDRWHSQKEELL